MQASRRQHPPAHLEREGKDKRAISQQMSQELETADAHSADSFSIKSAQSVPATPDHTDHAAGSDVPSSNADPPQTCRSAGEPAPDSVKPQRWAYAGVSSNHAKWCPASHSVQLIAAGQLGQRATSGVLMCTFILCCLPGGADLALEEGSCELLAPCKDPARTMQSMLRAMAHANASQRIDLDWQAQNQERLSCISAC